MYEYIPNPKTKKAKILGTALFFVSLGLFLASGIRGLAYRGILQFVAIAMMTAAILIIGRFLTRSYVYRVEKAEDGYDLIVDELTRSTRTTVCRLELAKLLRAEPWTKDTKPPRGTRIYSYCVDIAPDGSYILCFADGAYAPYEKEITLRIQPDERLVEILTSFIQKETDHEC